ncbi:MAG: DUF3261 domain-containing protein [Nevskia sp.]|nr:DUF3261 domain-containing protein [Nevskia sp.]
MTIRPSTNPADPQPQGAAMPRHALALAALCLAGCAAAPAPRPDVPPDQPPLLPPATLGASRDAQQILRAAFGEHEAVLRCVVHASPERIEVVALTALGQRALTVAWNGQDWKVDAAPGVPPTLRPEWLLADVQLALWPLAALQSAYEPAGWTVSEPGGGVRRLRRAGQLVAEVDYADADPWRGRYWISNFRYRYAISVEADATAP